MRTAPVRLWRKHSKFIQTVKGSPSGAEPSEKFISSNGIQLLLQVPEILCI